VSVKVPFKPRAYQGGFAVVNVTERAKHQLKWLAGTKLGRPDTAPRLVLSGAGVFRLIADGESDGDQRVEHEGRVILLIGRELGRPLAGSTLDWDETPHNARLVIKRQARNRHRAA
jgi:hypothetical protein